MIYFSKHMNENEVILPPGLKMKLVEGWYLPDGEKHFSHYLNEAKSKILTLSNENIEWHFIGKIQSNKVKDIVKHFSFIQTIASMKHAEIIDFECKKQNKIMDACIQINIDREDSKAGIFSDELDEFLEFIDNYEL